MFSNINHKFVRKSENNCLLLIFDTNPVASVAITRTTATGIDLDDGMERVAHSCGCED